MIATVFVVSRLYFS